ncbi:MAG: FAD-dependent oxidoreductase [Nitrospinae bacterium]|nr:FAD-dependent oxidoreductase [Nitrospinota bacterium]
MNRREFLKDTLLLLSLANCGTGRKRLDLKGEFNADLPHKIKGTKKVIIAGGGLSGLTAGIHLIERGFEVEIFEKNSFCGGKLESHKDSSGGCNISLEHGFHAWWGQYHNLIAMMRKLNIEKNLKEIPNVNIRIKGMRDETVYFNLQVYPFFLLFPLLFSKNISFREIMKSGTIGLLILRYDKKRYDKWFDKISFNDLMKEYDTPENIQKIFFEPFMKAGFFADAEEISAASFLELFHFYLSGNIGDFRCYHIGGNPQEKVIEPMMKYFMDRGGRINLNSEIENLIVDDYEIKGIQQFSEGGQSVIHKGDYFIIATDISGIQGISSNMIKNIGEERRDEFEKVLKLKTNNCIVIRIWFDKPTKPDRVPVGFVSDFKFITVYFILSRLNDDIKECSKNTGYHCIEFIIGGTSQLTEFFDKELLKVITPEIIELFPELRDAGMIDYFLMRHDNYTFFNKGAVNLRPSVQSVFKNLFYTGDWVYLDMPVFFMEKAVMTAKIVANYILSHEGVMPDNIHLPNVKGLLT